MTDIAARLKDLNIVLPAPPAPAANYVPYVVEGDQVIISGQICLENGAIAYSGAVGVDATLEQAIQAARLCGLNVLTQLYAAINGDWSRVKRCVRLGVFVNAPAGFSDHPEVANGASDLILDVFGADMGMHARAAVGCVSLPRNTTTEVEAIFALYP